MLLDSVYKNGKLNIFYIKDNEVKIEAITSKPYKWVYYTEDEELQGLKPNPKFKSWDDKPVVKIYDGYSMDRNVKMEHIWSLPENKIQDIFSNVTPREAFVDIETDFSEEFPEPSEAKFRVNTISIATLKNDTINVILLINKPLSEKDKEYVGDSIRNYISPAGYKSNLKVILFKKEADMLHYFFDKVCKLFHVITGWNFVEFDWHYLWNRAGVIGLNPKEIFNGFVSGTGAGFKMKGVKFPCSVAVLDLMAIFSKMDRSIEVKESMSLNFIASEIVNLEKISLNGMPLDELYDKEFPLYCFYNTIDAILCLLIEEKTKILKLYYSLSNISLCDVRSTIKPTRSTETVFSKKYYEVNKVLPSKEVEQNKSNYDGAYVMEPVPGFYKWVLARDFAALYPTSARMGNISPETYVGNYYYDYMKEVDDNEYLNYWISKGVLKDNETSYRVTELKLIKDRNNKVIYTDFNIFFNEEENKEKYKNWLISKNIISENKSYYISPKGVIFENDKPSIYKKILDEFTEKRKYHKSKKQAYIKELVSYEKS